jgi:hypothetical protein
MGDQELGSDGFMPPRMPDMHVDVVASEHGGEIRLREGSRVAQVTLRGNLWELFHLLLMAQLAATDESPHAGYRSTKYLRRALSPPSTLPLPSVEVLRRVNRLRDKLAEAWFARARPGKAAVDRFRMGMIEKNATGYRLSVPASNIRVSHGGPGEPWDDRFAIDTVLRSRASD